VVACCTDDAVEPQGDAEGTATYHVLAEEPELVDSAKGSENSDIPKTVEVEPVPESSTLLPPNQKNLKSS
jgi:hypothetical protein